MKDWDDLSQTPRRNQTAWLLMLRMVAAAMLVGGLIVGVLVGQWIWLGAAIGGALPLFILARFFDYLVFTARRARLLEVSGAKSTEAA